MKHKAIKQLCQLIVLTILFLVPLIYPLKVSDTVYKRLVAIFQALNLASFWQEQIEPFVFFGFSPLTLKETIAEALIISLFVFYLFYLAFGEDKKQSRRKFLLQHLPLILFIFYSGISIFYSPTFYYSFRSWFNLLCFAIFFLLVRELADSPAFLRKVILIMFVVAVIQCVISILQHLNLSSGFMLKFDEPRNRMGAFIGHNTGLSMFLMPSFFLALAMFLSARKNKVRLLLLSLLILQIFVFLVAQSRGSWIALLILTPLFFLYLRRYTGFSPSRRQLLLGIAIILFVLLSQILPNPLKSPEISFRGRLRHFLPERLRTETRLRILVCSLPLITQSPYFGYGIGSFQYVYPKVQGEYFIRYPNSILVPTAKRSQHAHNEYLQLLIELGLLGFFLILAAFYIYLKEGWAAFLKLNNPVLGARQIAIFFSLIAILIQSFVDFPFHIAPIGLYFIFLLALWSAGGQLLGVQEFKSSREYGLSANKQEESPIPLNYKILTFFRPAKVLALMLASAILIISPYIFSFIIINYSADLLYQRASSFAKTFYSYPEAPLDSQLQWLQEGKVSIKRALRLEPLSGLNKFKAAEVYYLFGVLAADSAAEQASEDEASKRKKSAYTARARDYFDQALFYAHSSFDELRIHSNYYLLGLIYRDLAELAKNSGDTLRAQEFLEQAKDNFFTAVKYTMAYAPALHELAELLLKEPNPQLNLIRELRHKIAKYDEEYFSRNYVKKVYETFFVGDYEKSFAIAQTLVEIAPERLDLREHLFYLCLALNDLTGAEGQLKIIQQREPNFAKLPQLFTVINIYHKNWAEAKNWLDKVLKNSGAQELNFVAVEPFLLERLGRKEEAKVRMKELEKKAKEEPLYLISLGLVAISMFGEEERGVNFLEKYLENNSPPSPRIIYFIAAFYAKKGEAQKALDYINRYKTQTRTSEKLRQLEQSLREQLSAKNKEIDTTLTKPSQSSP